MKLGAQFYTIRQSCQTLDDLSESLKRVADIGYETVQISGTCEYDPKWLKEQLDANGLQCVITHTDPALITGQTGEVIRNHDILNCDCVGLGGYGFSEETPEVDVEKFFADFGPAAKLMAQNGKYFMYHNHDREFRKIGGKTILELLAEGMPADQLGFTLDVFWVQAGGGDPAYWLEQLKGRVPCIHLKDYAFGKKMAVLGEGNINFDRILEKAETAGTKYLLVEQDDCNGEDPFDCLKRSYNYMKARGFK